jgi:signal transduction histidine kinase
MARRRGSLAHRLVLTYALSALGVLLALSLAVYLATALYLDAQLTRELKAQAEFHALYAARLASGEAALAGLAPTLTTLFAPQADLTVRFFAASDGALLAASQDLGPQPSRVALAALDYRSPTVFGAASRDLPHRRYAAQPIRAGGETLGVVEVSRSTLASERFLTTLRAILALAVLGGGVASALVSLALARRVSAPIRAVEAATHRIAAGDLDVRLSADAPDEVGRLAASVNRLAAQLRTLEAARTRFIGEISHDLRTPLTAIKGLLANLVDEAPADQRPTLALAEQETDRLIRLVQQLLDFSRWQGGRLTLERAPVDLGALARDAVRLSEARARHRRVTLMLDLAPDLPPVRADADRLRRVVLNLLDNALAFTPAGGRVTLSVRREGDALAVRVADTGRGMNAEERARAFEPYYAGAGGGAGLGLSIAQAIVEAHGGRMGIESEPGAGCCVRFRLPL